MKYLKNYSNWLLLFSLFNDYEIKDVNLVIYNLNLIKMVRII